MSEEFVLVKGGDFVNHFLFAGPQGDTSFQGGTCFSEDEVRENAIIFNNRIDAENYRSFHADLAGYTPVSIRDYDYGTKPSYWPL